MRSRAPLALTEQLIMILVFALSAALCLQVFAYGELASRSAAVEDEALLRASSAAEALKACADMEKAAELYGGEVRGGAWRICYDESWNAVPEGRGAYILEAGLLEDSPPLLGRAEISMSYAGGGEIIALEISWQEVDRGG